MLLEEDTVLLWLCLDSVEIQRNEKIGYVTYSNLLLILILYYSSINICNGAENNTYITRIQIHHAIQLQITYTMFRYTKLKIS